MRERLRTEKNYLRKERKIFFFNIMCIIKSHYSLLSQKFLTMKKVIGVGKEENRKGRSNIINLTLTYLLKIGNLLI